MATIHVYADESGTPPAADDAEVFLGAAFPRIGDPPAGLPVSCRSTPEATVRLLLEIGAESRCFFLRPGPGYERTLRAKHDALVLLARSQPLTDGGGNVVSKLRNWIWAEVMAAAVGATIAAALTRVGLANAARSEFILPPERIEVHFHRKAIGRPIRMVQRQVLAGLGEIIRETAEGSAPLIPDARTRSNFLYWARHFRLHPSAITVEWSHDQAHHPRTGLPNPHAGALCLADSFAYALHQELRKSKPTTGFLELLRHRGFTHDLAIDFTGTLFRGAVPRLARELHWTP